MGGFYGIDTYTRADEQGSLGGCVCLTYFVIVTLTSKPHCMIQGVIWPINLLASLSLNELIVRDMLTARAEVSATLPQVLMNDKGGRHHIVSIPKRQGTWQGIALHPFPRPAYPKSIVFL